MKKYMVALFNVELSMIMATRMVDSLEAVRSTFDAFADEYLDDWPEMSTIDKDCYFDCRGYQDSKDTGYMVQWFELEADGSFDNPVKL